MLGLPTKSNYLRTKQVGLCGVLYKALPRLKRGGMPLVEEKRRRKKGKREKRKPLIKENEKEAKGALQMQCGCHVFCVLDAGCWEGEAGSSRQKSKKAQEVAQVLAGARWL